MKVSEANEEISPARPAIAGQSGALSSFAHQEFMNSKIAHYLQEHLLGEVTDNKEIREHFSTDASILRLVPAAVAYPRNESDVRRIARFSWQLAERGRIIPLTARGYGSNTSGSAIGSGIIVVFTAHMNKLLNLDLKKRLVKVQPGASYDKIEQTLLTHGLFLPPYPVSAAFATIGGGVAANAIGEKSVKYGPTGDYVESLRIVLANGEIIETGLLSKRGLSHKMGLTSLEGDIYRAMDALIEENAEIIKAERERVGSIRSNIGYDLFDVKTRHGFDLTPLFIGALGTLGIITEIQLTVLPRSPLASLAIVSLNSLDVVQECMTKILELKPSIVDFINKATVDKIAEIQPNQLAGMLDNPAAAIHLFIEFDEGKVDDQQKQLKKLEKIAEKSEATTFIASEPADIDRILKVRQSVSTILSHKENHAKAIPLAEDISVPADKLADFLREAYKVYEVNVLPPVAWGHAGDGVIRMQPMLNLAEVGDRQKLFRISESLYDLAISMGGSISSSVGDGRIRAPYVKQFFSAEYYQLMGLVKRIFDPYGTLNGGVKFTDIEEIKTLMRDEYSLKYLDHLPRS